MTNYYSTGNIDEQISSTVVVRNLLQVAEGTDDTQRVGRRIFLRRLFLNARIYPTSNSTIHNTTRIVIFFDKQANGSTPTISDIFDNVNFMSVYDWNSVPKRYEIIYDSIRSFGGNWSQVNSASSEPQTGVIRLDIPLNRLVQYKGTTSAVTDIVSNSLWILHKGNQTLASDAGSNINYFCRVSYDDDRMIHKNTWDPPEIS